MTDAQQNHEKIHEDRLTLDETRNRMGAGGNAKTERRARRVWFYLAAVVAGLMCGLVAWQYHLAQERHRRLEAANWSIATSLVMAEATRNRAQQLPVNSPAEATAAWELWQEARAILSAGAFHAKNVPGVDPKNKADVARMQVELELAAQTAQERIVQSTREERFKSSLKKAMNSSLELRLHDFPEMHAHAIATYASAFRDYGLDVQRLDPPSFLKRWKLEPPSFRERALGSLFDWMLIDQREQPRLNEILELVDDDPWRKEVRVAFVRRDSKGLDPLSEQAMESVDRARVLACAFRQCGAVETSTRFLERAASKWPDDFSIQMQLGIGYANLPAAKPANYSDAVACFKSAVALSPRSAAAYGNLGRAYQLCDRLPEAQAHTDRAIELDPQIEQLHCNMASIHAARGEWTDVRRWTENALMLRPGSPQAVPLRTVADKHIKDGNAR
jgi:tetratricopeptide (TPR) repeat protein